MKFSFRSFILAVIFSIALISAKNVYSCDLSAQTDRSIQRAINFGEIERLYIGSSMFRQGINIYEMEQKKSKSRFLIWYEGLDPVSEFIILEDIISKGLTVKNLYVDMYAYSASVSSWPSGEQILFEASLPLKVKIWQTAMKNDKAELIPDTWEIFMHSGNDIFVFWPLFRYILSRTYYRGGHPGLDRVYNLGTTQEALQKIIPPGNENSRMNAEQKEAVIKIISLCRENNINLSFIETPKYASTHNSAGYKNLMAEYLEVLNEYNINCIMTGKTLNSIGAGQAENVKSYEFKHEDAGNFIDTIHLSTAGSAAFTHILIEIE